jgi:hypothetical protein
MCVFHFVALFSGFVLRFTGADKPGGRRRDFLRLPGFTGNERESDCYPESFPVGLLACVQDA